MSEEERASLTQAAPHVPCVTRGWLVHAAGVSR